MNIAHLRYAVEVERTGSITQAAENLYMGQPNLSKAIKELEESVGILLFKRSSKGVAPTKKGAEFLQYARNILAQIEEMEAHYRPENPDKQRFNICVPRGSYIANAFAQFVSTLDMNKEIDVNFKETNSMRAIHSVAEGEFDMGIIRYQTAYESYFLNFLQDKQLQYEPVWEFEYLALLSKEHPLAGRKTLLYSELAEHIEIAHGDLSIPYLSLNEVRQTEQAGRAKKKIYVYERGSQFDLLTHIPATYMWVSPVPEETLTRYGLVQRRCSVADHKYKDILISPKGYQYTALEKAFIEKLYAVRDEVSKKEYD